MRDKTESFKRKFRCKWNHFKKSVKEDPTYRAVCITTVILVLSVAMLVTITAVANRVRKQPPTVDTTDTGSPETTAPIVTDPPATEPPVTEPVDALPSAFMLPVSGALTMKHDATTQVFSNTMQDYRVHLGIDVGTEANASVYAAADGKIERIWDDVRYGQCVAIAHSGQCITIYKNLSYELPEGITEGASVSAGALIGTVGDSAMVEIADEPHLHFEMTVNGLAVDPLEYFDASALASLSVDASYEG